MDAARSIDDTVFRPLTAYPGNGDFSRLPLDVRTTPDALLVEAALPGIWPEDVEITRRLREVGDLMGIRVLDHVVIGRGRYVSFVDDGYW